MSGILVLQQNSLTRTPKIIIKHPKLCFQASQTNPKISAVGYWIIRQEGNSPVPNSVSDGKEATLNSLLSIS